MPLFIGQVVVKTFEIPVSAVNEQEAIEYLNSTTEWKEELFPEVDPESIFVVGAKQVTTPTQTPQEWESGEGCWGKYDQTVAETFLEERLCQIMPKVDAFDETSFKKWDDFYEEKSKLCAEFDKARKIKGE